MPQSGKSPRKNAKHSLELAAGPILFYNLFIKCEEQGGKNNESKKSNGFADKCGIGLLYMS